MGRYVDKQPKMKIFFIEASLYSTYVKSKIFSDLYPKLLIWNKTYKVDIMKKMIATFIFVDQLGRFQVSSLFAFTSKVLFQTYFKGQQ